MNRNVTCVTPWWLWRQRDRSRKIIFDYLCCFENHPVRGELRDHVFNSTTTTGFSDLDGTLLDSHSYDWQPAAPSLSRLREANVPVILCSSKTSAEMLYLQKRWGYKGYH